jgi:cytochrome c-type biogenesis protein CcmH
VSAVVTLLLAALVALALIPGSGRAGEPAFPAAEARAGRLAAELRCLVCQNQSLADSNAELAVDLRGQIREQIAQGRSDDEIVDYMVQRYGDFVLYRPPVKAATWLLWFGPALLLLVGLGVLGRSLAARRRRGQEPPLPEPERERARRLLAADGEDGHA